jgi:hypothetical protein
VATIETSRSKRGAEGLVVHELAGQHLDGHQAVHGELARLVDDRHPAPPKFLEDFVSAEVLAYKLFRHTRCMLSMRRGLPAQSVRARPGSGISQ